MAKKKQAQSFLKTVRSKTSEIVVIVFSILISLWLNNWNEQRKKNVDAMNFLSELTDDLNADIRILNDNIEILNELNSNYQFLLNLQHNEPDSVIGPYTTFSFLIQDFNIARYEGFKLSGKIGNIENRTIKNNILTYYQQKLPKLVNLSEFINNEQLEIVKAYNSNYNSAYEFYNSRNINRMLRNLDYNFSTNINSNQRTIDFIKKLISDIEKESK